MKKLICVVSIVALMMACLTPMCTAFASSSSESYPFDLTMTKLLDGYTVNDWMGNSQMRAMITVLLSTDLSVYMKNHGLSYDGDLSKNSYVGQKDNMLMVYMHGSSQDYIIAYMPSAQIATYTLTAGSSDTVVEMAMSTTTTAYYKNSLSDLKLVIDKLLEILGG